MYRTTPTFIASCSYYLDRSCGPILCCPVSEKHQLETMARMASTFHNGGAMKERKKPTFFKVIKTDINTKDLRIPPKFRKHIWNELSETAILELKDSPYGSWTVEVSQCGRDIYLNKGWKKFVRDNCLGDYEFLIFRYESNMHFSIQIFENTGCNRKYENSRVASSSVQTWGGSIKCCKSEPAAEEDEANKSPQSKFPTFKCIIKGIPNNITVPTVFSKKYLPRGYYSVTLKSKTLEGEWSVRIVPSSTTVRLSAGWIAFRSDNGIKLGDICTFELVKTRTLMVHIVRK